MKIEVVLKPCPWCKKTPDIWMPIEGDTWCWLIQCNNYYCRMKPKSPHVSIRKTTKSDFFLWHGKVESLAHRWNAGNPFKAFEMKVIDLERLPDLNRTSEFLCNRDPRFTRIDAI